MPRLHVGGRRLSLAAEVPAPVADALRGLKRSIRTLAPASRESLVLAEHLPTLELIERDPAAAIEFLPAPEGTDDRSADPTLPLTERVASVWWYHTIELPGGVATPGFYDHRPLVAHYGLPADLGGRRALDIATFDGFWAFEMERRGASVVATDIERISQLDLPPQARDELLASGRDRTSGGGFRLAHQARQSTVERVLCDVYDLSPATVGVFDFVHVADLLLHLERPLEALRAIRRVTGDTALIVDCFDPALGAGQTNYLGGWSGAVWWLPSLSTLAQMVLDAGFSAVEVHTVYALGNAAQPRGQWRAALVATA